LTKLFAKSNTEEQMRAMADKPAAKVSSAGTYDWLPDGLFLIRCLDAHRGDKIVLTKRARLRILPYIKTISYQYPFLNQ